MVWKFLIKSPVLLDGDLQDPELIEKFIIKWREGYDVVYGDRVKREMPFYIEFFYKSFYFIFDKMSSLNIPRNAGDFSLIDKKEDGLLNVMKEIFFLEV